MKVLLIFLTLLAFLTGCNESTSVNSGAKINGSNVGTPPQNQSVPSAFSILEYSFSDSTALIKWSGSANANYYELRYRIGNVGSYATVATVGTSYMLTGLNNGNSYTAYVVARNNFGTSQTQSILLSPQSGINVAPVAKNISLTMTEDFERKITLNYTDANGQPATSCSISNLTNLSISEACLCTGGTCEVTIKPISNYSGSASFKYSVSNDLTSNIASTSISILPVDDAPIAYNINPTNLTLGVEAEILLPYSDAEGDLATVCYISNFKNGSVTTPCNCVNGICSVGVTNPEYLTGEATFDYEVRAGSSISNVGKATLSLVPRPVLSYGGTPGTSIKLGTSFNVEPTIISGAGGTITGCTTTPALPAGITINATSCKITGTPSTTLSPQTYQVTASGSLGDSLPATVVLAVSPAAPSISYAASTGNAGQVGALMSVTPSTLNTHGAPLTGCTVTPALPYWASINPGTCIISGTPNSPLSTTNYTVIAHNAAGSSLPTIIALSVNAAPPVLSYSSSTGKTVTLGQTLTVIPSAFQENGSSITSCSASPALPVWATINPSTCVISGTASTVLPLATFTITAINSIGSTTATVALTVNPAAPNLSYTYSSANGAFGVPITVIPSLISANGSSIHTCTAWPALPSWATLDQNNCRITGTPNETLIPPQTYTVTATNGAGTSAPAILILRVDPSVPVLSYSGAAGTNGTYGAPMNVAPTIFQNKGGAIFQCNVTPTLPSWATINSSTCEITGTPNALLPVTYYSVVARNSAGFSAAATVVLRVNPAVPEISYAGSYGTAAIYNVPTTITPTVFKNGGTNLNSCTSSPALPAWAIINSTTCVITGTPNQALSPSTFAITASNSTGSYTTNVNISVEPKVPTISYAGSTGTTGFTGNSMTIAPSSLVANGATIIECKSTPSLPAWLTIDNSTCVVTGTPSSLMEPTTYTIFARNSKGFSSGALLTIKVEELSEPTISYLGSTGTNGVFGAPMLVAPTTLNPNGRPITDCTVSPALPSWATIDPLTCVISGTPTSILSATTYTVKAKNLIGIGSGTVTLKVVAAAPTLSYAGSGGKTGSYGSPMTITPTSRSSGGVSINNCYSEPALPTGLVIDPVTCVISGTPTVAIPSTSYIIKAVNSAGTSAGSPITLIINAIAPELSYVSSSGTTVNFGTNFNVVPSVISPNGSTINSCTASPSLPTGLTINGLTCVISGVSSVALVPTTFTITATNGINSTTANVTLTVNPIAPVLSYSGAIGTIGAINNPMTVAPTTFNTNGAPAQSCTISPALPTGVTINSLNCVISGTPTALLPPTTYTITLSNGFNPNAVATVSLEVKNFAVPSVSFIGATGTTGAVGSLMTVTPTALSPNGDPITNCTVSPALPLGLTIDTLTCVISGTPLNVLPAKTFQVTALNNIGPSSPASVVLTINAQAPTLSYSDTIGNQGTLLTINPASFSPNGSSVTSCTVSPGLPPGLTLNMNSCVISGTPSAIIPETIYTITATNDVGPTTASLKLSILPGLPIVSFSGATGTVGTFGNPMNVAPTLIDPNGGAINNCTISPSLPSGLTIDLFTCVISGTSSIAFAPINFTVKAYNNAGASAGASVTLRVNAGVPDLSFVGSSGTNGSIGGAMSVSPTALNNRGATITGCSATTLLPTWATINPVTCVLTGTPTESLPSTTYSIIATNSAGNSLPASLTLSVNANAPTLSYVGSAGTNGIFGMDMEVLPTAFNGNGQTVNQCVVTPALPSGLSISASTCIIAGIPTQVTPAMIYNVRATNTGGIFTDASITLSVSANTPVISFALSDTHGENLNELMVITPSTLQERGAAITCSVTPALPAGFNLNPSTCIISGTPSTNVNSLHTVTATNSAGSTNTSLNITAGVQVPSLSYATSTGKTISYNGAFNIQPSTLQNFGSSLTNCVFTGTPAKPSWLNIDSSSCTISGVPTSSLPSTTFNVIATNALGDSTPAPITLEVTPLAPFISYAGASGNGPIGSPMTVSPMLLRTNGGDITNCTITPALTNNLAIDPLTCVISGTPSAAMSATEYTVIAYNSAGPSPTATVTISVAQVVPVLSYVGSTGTTVNLNTPTTVNPASLSGQPITNCTIYPALPNGLTIDTITCVITGTPTVVTTGTYYVTATNSAGPSNGASVVLTINPIAPEISFTGSAGTTGTIDSLMTVAPTTLKSNGATVACSISPSLPAGLTFNTTTCEITGTPTATMAATLFTVTATNSEGSAADTVTLTVDPATPILSYSGASGKTGNVNIGMSVTPTLNTRGSSLSSCTISPMPPAWMNIDGLTCVISGTPTTSLPLTTYTVTATNLAGSTTATVDLSVNIAAPLISYGSPTLSVDVGQTLTITTTTLNDYGSPVYECNVSPSLPAGLTISAPSCAISGAPTTPLTATVFTVTAKNSAGTSTGATFSLEILANPPVISYAGAVNTNGTVGYAMYVSPTTLNDNGSAIVSCTVSPALPTGLDINNTTCMIFGSPVANFGPTTYTVTATNGRGPSSAVVTLSTGDTVPSLSYVGAAGTVGNLNTPMTITPSSLSENGSPITSCEPTPALPTGLIINSSTCVISGTPTVVTAAVNYSVIAMNSLGSSVAAPVTIEVKAGAPILSYAGATGTQGSTGTSMNIAPTAFGANGSAINSCTISPAPPTGVTIDNLTCVISGTPTVNSTTTIYTVSATNGIATTTATVEITVGQTVPEVSYVGSLGTSGVLGSPMNVTPTSLKANGSSITGCTVSPALPTGVTINNLTCVISGTPTVVSMATIYDVVAENNSGNSVPASVTISVAASAPTISYAAGTTNVDIGSLMWVEPTTLNDHGSEITVCTANPMLPSGIDISPPSCVITGTPSSSLSPTVYTITAQNSVGSATATVSLSVGVGVPTLSYAGAGGTVGDMGESMTVSPTSLELNGSAISQCNSSPTLPTGLTINQSTCVISGTPTVQLPATVFTITAKNNSGFSSGAPVTLQVTAGRPTLSYSGAIGTNAVFGVPTFITPALQDNGSAILTCTITPALPLGLSINNTTCVISGTPADIIPATVFNVVAENDSGPSNPASVTISVEAGYPELSYDGALGTTGDVGVPLSVSPTTLNGNGSSIEVCMGQNVPYWASIDPHTCVITGTPDANMPTTIVTITAETAEFKQATATVEITVGKSVPVLSYDGVNANYNFADNVEIIPSTLKSNGAAIEACEVVGPVLLPAWAILNQSTCIITGSADSAFNDSVTIRARNSEGYSNPVSLYISVSAGLPEVSYVGATGTTGVVGAAMTIEPTTLKANGGEINSCYVSGTDPFELPTGLTIDSTTCIISGTPTGAFTETFEITVGTLEGGNSMPATVTLTVGASKPTLVYTGSKGFPGYVDSYLTGRPSEFSNNGDPLLSCLVTAGTLPAWASINQENCEINGTPPAEMTSINLTITATNNFGSTSANVSLEVMLCPTGFVEVPAWDDSLAPYGLPLDEQVVNDRFCVMQFEAKDVGGKATSQPGSAPWINVAIGEAEAACKELGLPDQDLFGIISNQEWMSIARQVEDNDANWMFDDIDPLLKVRMYTGLTNKNGFPSPISVSNVNNPYTGTGSSATDSIGNGKERRRTFILGNNSEIWDMSGNAWEWVDWDKTQPGVQIPPFCTSADQVDFEISGILDEFGEVRTACTGWEKKDFYPLTPNLTNADHGIGVFDVDSSKTQQINRGGDPEESGGIYSVGREDDLNIQDPLVGFRCVYRPNIAPVGP